MSYVFGNSSPYAYDLYTSGGQTASIAFSDLTQGAADTNYVVIVDISNTVNGTFSYTTDNGSQGSITKTHCPFLISDINGFTDLSCTIVFTPSENRDGYGSLLYYTVSRYTPIVKKQIRQVCVDDSITEELLTNTNGYDTFQKMETPFYCYSLVESPDRIVLLTTATTNTNGVYFNTTGIPILNGDGTLNTSWTYTLDELGYGPKDTTIYDNSANYYRIPLMIEYVGDNVISYVNENLIVSYTTNSLGLVYRYTPSTRTIGVKVFDDGSLAGGGSLDSARNLLIMRDVDGALSSPPRVFYAEFKNKIYRAYQYKNTFQHSNRAPTLTAGASLALASYNIATIDAAAGTTVSAILASSGLGYSDANSEYDRRGLIMSMPTTTNIQGNWAYRLHGETGWTFMNFTDVNGNTVYWYLPEKKTVSGVDTDIYIKFISSTNANGTASLVAYGWDRTNTTGPTDGPVADALISYSETGAISSSSATLVQTMVKINYPPSYNSTIGNTYTTVNQDTVVSLQFDSTFFSTIGFLDLSGPGPGVGVVIEDVSGGGFGAWSWRFENEVEWKSFTFAGRGFHIQQAGNVGGNVVMRFVPEKYKYGTASFRARLWDMSVDVSNGTYAVVPAVHDPNGAYSASSKTWNVVVVNVDDPPKIYDGTGVEIVNTYTKRAATYIQGYVPADDGSDALSVASILADFTPLRIYAANIVDVDNGFVNYDTTQLGIIIEDVSGAVDVSFQRLVSAGTWRSYSASEFFDGGLRKYLHLSSTDVFRFRVGQSTYGQDIVSFRFRIWNRRNINASAVSGSISAYNTVTATGAFYSIPITATITYDDSNQAPIVNVQDSTYIYTLPSMSEDSGDSIDFDISTIIETLRTTTVGGQPLITDADGEFITQIPLFGLALTEIPVVQGFPSNPGTWKYRATPNAPAETLTIENNNFFHVAPGMGSKLFYTPSRHTYGQIQLVGRIWDRSNEDTVSAGMYHTYTGSYDRVAPYSAKTVTFQMNIINVNDRPYLVSGRMFLNTVSANATDPQGQTLFNIMRTSGFIVADPDPQDIGSHGIVITGLSDSRLGTWQYMVDGSTWKNIQVASLQGIHLRPLNSLGGEDTNTRLRYLPNPSLTRNRTGLRLFQFYIWDTTNGLANESFQIFNPQTDTSYSLISYSGRISVST